MTKLVICDIDATLVNEKKELIGVGIAIPSMTKRSFDQAS